VALYLAVNHRGQRALLYVPRALHDTVRQWLANGRRLYQQLAALHQQQLEELLRHKQQVLTRPASSPSRGADPSP
jgi:hypothetical protein